MCGGVCTGEAGGELVNISAHDDGGRDCAGGVCEEVLGGEGVMREVSTIEENSLCRVKTGWVEMMQGDEEFTIGEPFILQKVESGEGQVDDEAAGDGELRGCGQRRGEGMENHGVDRLRAVESAEDEVLASVHGDEEGEGGKRKLWRG